MAAAIPLFFLGRLNQIFRPLPHLRYLQVVKRVDSAAFFLEQMQRMNKERAAMEQRFAKDLRKFSARWEDRLAKSAVFAEGEFYEAGLAAAREALRTAEAHTERHRVLTEGQARK